MKMLAMGIMMMLMVVVGRSWNWCCRCHKIPFGGGHKSSLIQIPIYFGHQRRLKWNRVVWGGGEGRVSCSSSSSITEYSTQYIWYRNKSICIWLSNVHKISSKTPPVAVRRGEKRRHFIVFFIPTTIYRKHIDFTPVLWHVFAIETITSVFAEGLSSIFSPKLC